MCSVPYAFVIICSTENYQLARNWAKLCCITDGKMAWYSAKAGSLRMMVFDVAATGDFLSYTAASIAGMRRPAPSGVQAFDDKRDHFHTLSSLKHSKIWIRTSFTGSTTIYTCLTFDLKK
jgi:hypothetical protein